MHILFRPALRAGPVDVRTHCFCPCRCVKDMRVCVGTDVELHRCLPYTTSSPLPSQVVRPTLTRCPTYAVHISTCLRSHVVLHGRLSKVCDLLVVSGSVLEQQLIEDLDNLLHHTEASAQVGRRHALHSWDARQDEARALDLNSIGKTSLLQRTSLWVPKLPIPVRGVLWCHGMQT